MLTKFLLDLDNKRHANNQGMSGQRFFGFRFGSVFNFRFRFGSVSKPKLDFEYRLIDFGFRLTVSLCLRHVYFSTKEKKLERKGTDCVLQVAM